MVRRNNSKWTFMMREVLDHLMTPELQAKFNWGGMLGALSTQEKNKFQNTTHSKLVMQVVTLRTRLFPNPYCREAELMQVSEMPACINRSNVLRQAVGPLNIAITQRHMADELLALVALLVEATNVTATVEDVLEFVL